MTVGELIHQLCDFDEATKVYLEMKGCYGGDFHYGEAASVRIESEIQGAIVVVGEEHEE
jgi:hypothetical protein